MHCVTVRFLSVVRPRHEKTHLLNFQLGQVKQEKHILMNFRVQIKELVGSEAQTSLRKSGADPRHRPSHT